jgi:hypothetical protein
MGTMDIDMFSTRGTHGIFCCPKMPGQPRKASGPGPRPGPAQHAMAPNDFSAGLFPKGFVSGLPWYPGG